MSMIWLPPTRYDWYVDLSGERAFTDDHLILLCAACGLRLTVEEIVRPDQAGRLEDQHNPCMNCGRLVWGGFDNGISVEDIRMAYDLTCLLCDGAAQPEGATSLVLMQEHLMRDHHITQDDLRRCTHAEGAEDGATIHTYTLPDGRPWLKAVARLQETTRPGIAPHGA